MNRAYHTLRFFLRDESGSPMMEFAAIGGIIAVTIPAMIDTATLINGYMRMNAALRAGAQYALKNPSSDTGIAQAVKSASNLPDSTLTVSTSVFCECDGVSAICANTCSYGVQLATHKQITLTYNISGRYSYGLYPSSISRTVAVRTQ